jgi:hypothetical protein
MVIVALSFVVLLTLSIIARRIMEKLIQTTLTANAIIKTHTALFIAVLFTYTATLYFIAQQKDLNTYINAILIALCLTTSFLSYAICFLVLNGKIKGTFVSIHVKSTKIDIQQNFFPSIHSKQDAIHLIEGFTSSLLSWQNAPFRVITFESHLITPRIRKVMTGTLTKSGVRFSCHERRTPWCEVILLNLRYGGKTRYRVFSLKKHANGFKVHRIGSSLSITIPGP